MINENDSLELSAAKLQMSPTLERLFHLSQGYPCDVTQPEDLRTALASCGIPLIYALDSNRIHFDSDEDKAMLYGLLTATTDYVMGGNLRTAFKPVTSKH
jgi:hypothetical protein